MIQRPANPLQQELERLNRDGQFIAAVLTDGDGLPIAAATPSDNQLADMLAAIAPLVERLAQRSNERAGFSAAQEVVIDNADRTRLVCRFFEARRQRMILACVVPAPLSFRREMSKTMRALQKME
jgi:predicted regulator of Ras-like GTPase activity (Roadblock/LC7/MglB family)